MKAATMKEKKAEGSEPLRSAAFSLYSSFIVAAFILAFQVQWGLL
jgi:hypothetical protein